MTDLSLFITALVGRGGGKTTGDMFRKVIRMLRTPRAKLAYVATTRPQAEILMWSPLKELCDALDQLFGGFRIGEDVIFNETKLWCTFLRNGSVLRLVGADDKREIDKLRGQPFHEVTIDEAASFPPKLLEELVDRIIGPRLGDYNGTICMIGTPGHVLKGPFYDFSRPGSTGPDGKPMHRPYRDRDSDEYRTIDPVTGETHEWAGYSSHSWNLRDDVVEQPDAEERFPRLCSLYRRALVNKANKQWSDDNPVWMREYLGRWAADDTAMMFRYRAEVDGQPWNQWDPPRVGPMLFGQLPNGPDGKPRTDWLYAYGMDMGHSDPFALVVFAFSPSDTTRTLYHVFSFEKTKMYSREIAQLLLGVDMTQPSQCCPHGRPEGVIGVTGWPAGMVSDMTHLGESILLELQNVYGIKAGAAEQKSKYASIELFNGDLLDGRIKILKDSTLEAQLLDLQWVPNEFGQLKEPKGVPNHSADAAIYARRLIAHMFDTGTVKTDKDRPAQKDTSRPILQTKAIEEFDDLPEPNWNDLYR